MHNYLILLVLFLPVTGTAQPPADQRPIECSYCDQWNQPQTPYQLAANTWYVGTRGLSSVLIADSGKLALIDGALPQSAGQIIENITALGFDPLNIEWILNSHPHYDHAGGIAALARITGARVAAGPKAVVALELGPYHPDDPQAGFGESARFPSVPGVRPVGAGDSVMVGETRITAIASPGHTPGGMTWTWQSCTQDSICTDVVYLDSLTAVSADGYRFTDHPETVADLEASIDRIAGLPCDVAIAAHPDATPEAEPGGTICQAYADSARLRLARRLANEQDNEPGN